MSAPDLAGALAGFVRPALPAAPRRVRIGMPQLDAGGLSEGWLHRYAGDLHWEAIARALGVESDELCGAEGERLYPTVVALRARYQSPLSTVRENDVLEAKVNVVPCGRSCAHGRIDLSVDGRHASLELLTTFAAREGAGPLRMALPAAELAARWRVGETQPPIARLAKAARCGQPLDDEFSGPSLGSHRPALDRLVYEPSPYADYNGARLLYFASYVTIADTAERSLVRRLGLSPRPQVDWALATSAIRRDVFYYCNLPLGESLAVELIGFELRGPRVKTRVRLRRLQTEQVMADLVTERLLVPVRS